MAANAGDCKEKCRLLDAFGEAMSEYARTQVRPSDLSEEDHMTVREHARKAYEDAKLALRLHRKNHGC